MNDFQTAFRQVPFFACGSRFRTSGLHWLLGSAQIGSPLREQLWSRQICTIKGGVTLNIHMEKGKSEDQKVPQTPN